jgi:hypothetical protein
MEARGQHHAPVALPPGRNPGTHWSGRCVGLGVVVDVYGVEKISCPPGRLYVSSDLALKYLFLGPYSVVVYSE